MNFNLTVGKIAGISFLVCLVAHGIVGGMALTALMLCGVYGVSKYAE